MTAAGGPLIGGDPALEGRYAVGEPIASGGFASVFKASQRTTGQEVAIKVLQPERRGGAAALEEQIERFRREMRLCAELHHPNVVPLIDSGETSDGRLYAVFAYVPGWTLGDVLAAEGAIEPEETVHFMTQVIDAVSCAHARGIVHRDLKPGNIMISSTGVRRNALVLDFGLATLAGPWLPDLRRLTRRGDFLGTPLYSAPEQLRGEPPTVSSDLYAWGLIFLECLTGEPAMGSSIPHEVVHRHLSPEPVPIPAALEGLGLGRLLRLVTEKDVRRRSDSAAAVFSGLRRCAREGLPSREAVSGASRTQASRTWAGAPHALRESPRELSPIWLVPLGRNPNFTGREELLGEITASLDVHGLLAVVALRGMGGVGKTQLALEYVYRCSERYRLVAWLRAEAPETLAADYCAIATPLGIPETPNEQRKIEAVRSWLERNGDWLLVFDNAPNPEVIRAYLPRSHAGHILVTSRHQSWRGLASSLGVEVLDLREAVEFLRKRTGETDADTAAELCQELGRLPLALEEASAYLEATGRSISTYLSLLRSHQRRMLLGEPLTPAQPGALRTTWEISFRQVEREVPDASDLLKLCAFLAPDDIPLELFRLGAEHLPGRLPGRVHDEVAFDACVAALRRYSLVKAERDCLSIHRLVQLATRERLPEAERPLWTTSALRVVEAAFPRSATAGDYQPESGRFLPHALAALAHAAPYTECPALAGRLLRRTGIYLSARGLLDRALQDLEQALGLFERAEEPSESQIATVLWELGMNLYALGELPAARERLERATRVLERHRGPTHLLVGQGLITLSQVLRALGDLEASLSTAQRSLDIFRSALGAEHPITSTSLSAMGRALWGLNRVREAGECAERALAVLARAPESMHPLICKTWNDLAQIQLDLGDFDRALDCVRRGIEIGERAYGLDHPLVYIGVFLRGVILRWKGDLEGARRCFERALASGQRTCRHLHEEVALSRAELGNVLRLLGDFEAARSNLEHSLEGASRVSGDRTRFEAHARVLLASLHRDLGDLTQARALCESGIRLLDARYAIDHPLRISGLNVLGWILRDLGEADQARRSFATAIGIAEAAGLLGHPDHAESVRGARSCASSPSSRGA